MAKKLERITQIIPIKIRNLYFLIYLLRDKSSFTAAGNSSAKLTNIMKEKGQKEKEMIFRSETWRKSIQNLTCDTFLYNKKMKRLEFIVLLQRPDILKFL